MTSKKQRLLLGAHMSIADGLEKSIERGESIGCTTIQIFTKSNRQWQAKALNDEQTSLFRKTMAASSIYPVVAHATYLINIASADSKTAQQSIKALINELARCDQLAIPFLVLHPGSYGKGTREDGMRRLHENLEEVLQNSCAKTVIALETMAGQGSSLGSSFEELATLINDSSHKKRLGVCFDTCHAFVAGYDFRTPASYEKMWQLFDQTIGLNYLKVIHVNDSKKGLNSRIDRHEHIGQGQLGLAPFELLFNDDRFFDIPKILETPKDTQEPLDQDTMNMETIKSLLTNKTKKMLGIE